MTRQTLIKGLIAAALGAQVFGLTPSVLNDCQAQEGVKSVHELKLKTWVALGGQFQRGLSVVTTQSWSSLRVDGEGSDGARWSIESTDKGKTWGSFISHKGLLLSAPGCEYVPHGNGGGVRCAWISTGGFLWSQYQEDGGADGEFVQATMSAGAMTSTPSLVSGHVFARGAGDALWAGDAGFDYMTKIYNFGVIDWESRGGALKGGPSCLKTGSYHVKGAPPNTEAPKFTCYVLGTDDAVWEERHDDVYSMEAPVYHNVWTRLGGQGVAGVNAWGYNSANGTKLAVLGTDSTLWVAWRVPTQGSVSGYDWQWKNYPGKIASVPACQLTYCFAILPDGQLGFLDLTGRL